MKKIHLFCFLLISITTFAGDLDFINLKSYEQNWYRAYLPRIFFDIRDFGAKGDGKRITDGAISSSSTTFTSATAAFTSADVGKVIRVPRAGAASVDLITTIAGFTNSTTVTLTASASTSVTGDTVVYGTDNTTPIQKAIWADSVNTGGVIWIPRGVFCVGGPLITSAFGGNPNSQIYFPQASVTTGFSRRTHYVIEGETPPNYLNYSFADTLTGLNTSIIYSMINGSGNAPAVFGTTGIANNLTYNYFTFKNLTIMVAQNINAGGPSIGGINMWYAASLICDQVSVCVDGNIIRSVQPTNEVAGIISNGYQSEIHSSFNLTQVTNFKYGLVVTEGAYVDHYIGVVNQNGLVFPRGSQNVQVNYYKAYWNNINIFVPNATILGFITAGTCYLNITNMESEVFTASGNWYDYSNIVTDAGNRGVGWVNYTIVQAGIGYNNGLFNKSGATGILCYAIGAAPAGTPPGGSNTQVQYNNSSAFGGISGATTNGTSIFIPKLYGSAATAGNLTLGSTNFGSGSTNKGKIILDSTRGSYYSEAVGNLNLGVPDASNYAISAIYTDLTGGAAIFPGLFLQNKSASSPGGGQYNLALTTLQAGNGAIIGQFAANYGSGATAPFTVQGFVIGTRTADPVIFFYNSTQVARLDASSFNPYTTLTPDLGTSSLKWRDVYSRGRVGTTTNDNAQAGSEGEYVSSLIALGSAVSLTTVTAANVTSISLTAGDWDVEGNVNFNETGATVAARSAGISSTSATIPSDGSEAYLGAATVTAGEFNSITPARKRFSLSGTTTVYLTTQVTFIAGTVTAFGNITARRIR